MVYPLPRLPDHRPGSRRRCTLAEVADIDAAAYEAVKEGLARHFLEELGAPSIEAARAAAEDECAYTADLAGGCAGSLVATLVLIPMAGLAATAGWMAVVAGLMVFLI